MRLISNRPIIKLKLYIVLDYYRVRYFRGRVSNFNQSEARKDCFLASDWSKFETPPHKYRTQFFMFKFHSYISPPQCVRWSLLPQSYIAKEVVNEPVLKDYLAVKDMIINALIYHLDNHPDTGKQNRRFFPRHPSSLVVVRVLRRFVTSFSPFGVRINLNKLTLYCIYEVQFLNDIRVSPVTFSPSRLLLLNATVTLLQVDQV